MVTILFYVFAGLAVGGAVGVVMAKSPVGSLLFMVTTLAAMAGTFVLLEAHFLAAIQIIVYAGAIMVLFLFVIMLLNLGHDFDPDVRGRFWWVFGGGLALVLFAELLTVVTRSVPDEPRPDIVAPLVEARGAVAAVAEPLFQNYVVALEVTGLLLLVAMVGAVVIAKQKP